MLTKDWLTDAVLYIYALSLLFFVSDAASGKRKRRRIGTGLLVFVWILQTAFLLDILIARLSMPAVTLQEYAFFVSWLLVSFSLVINRFVRAELLVLLVNAVGFAVLGLNLLERPQKKIVLAPGEAAQKLLVVHVAFIILAFVILTIAALLGGMYLFLNNRLKKKKWGSSMSRMPSLEAIESYVFRAAVVGVPLLLLSLTTGAAALLVENRYSELGDEKVLLSFAAGIVYIVYLLRRMAGKVEGTRVLKWILVGYAMLIVDFFANSYSSFHRWM
ncbi:cytochrome C assembly family protein [Cohnella zeiphila]|uniref:Cytochrome c biogenesis protein CcsA n=1 Tax=Cohnella zeiphila TaxID=2761120 RepID=A0A7X0VSX9_9BACL|nr:cytochrome c biogenesis protein CcsA [Cohnella zeiphila]MBB6729294.1 cytochrome c biogenesis protein CcsA [Cohnella zeiphila]